MQSVNEYVCADCGNTSDCASDLLKHFAQHVKVDDTNFFIAENSKQNRKSTIPDLYPISVFKELHSNASPISIKTDGENEDLSPSNYCEIMLGKTRSIVPDDSQHSEENKTIEENEEFRSPIYDHMCIKQSLLKKHRFIDTKGSQVSSKCEKIKPHLKRKQQKCSIKRKCTKFVVQSGINSLLCST